MIRKIVCFGIVLFIMVMMFACEKKVEYEPKEQGDFYSLQEAYDQGMLTKDDLLSIAYYKNGGSEEEGYTPIPKNPDVLSAETENAIKETRAYDLRNQNSNSIKEAKADDVKIHAYYGTYNNCVAVLMSDRYHDYLAVEIDVTIDGVTFHYSNTNAIIVWLQK